MTINSIYYCFGLLLSNTLVFLTLMSSIVMFKNNYTWSYVVYFACLAITYAALYKRHTYKAYYIYGTLFYIMFNAIGLTFSLLILDGM